MHMGTNPPGATQGMARITILVLLTGLSTLAVGQEAGSTQLREGALTTQTAARSLKASGADAMTTDVSNPPAHVPQPLHPSKCAPACTKHGTCNEELGRCDCPKHLDGEDCSQTATHTVLQERCTAQHFNSIKDCLQPDSPACLNRCNGRGICVSGFCHCYPGHYGTDCSLSLDEQGKPQLLRGTNYTTRAKRPWIYVYELPPEYTQWGNLLRVDRPVAHLVWQRLLSSGARTAHAAQADWFYLPVRQRGFGDRYLLSQLIPYLRATWPHWDRLQGGHRHFLFATGDTGVAELDKQSVALAENVTWLSHWGLTKDHPVAGWPAAHRPGKDIVVPVTVSAPHYYHNGMDRSSLHPLAKDLPARDQTLFFAGRVCGSRQAPIPGLPAPQNCGKDIDGYSGGVRQAVWAHHANRTGYTLKLREKNYARAMSSHNYCLAPLGGGHGQRQVIVSYMGCVPLLIGDNVLQPFEPELPWPQFSVSVAEQDVGRLHTILDAIPGSQLARYQAALRCAAQHLLWTTLNGSFMRESGRYDAFETILEILRMKLKYPDAKPEEYIKLDADYRRFVACGAEEFGQDIPDALQPSLVCSHSWFDSSPPNCQPCRKYASQTHGIPGGYICCKSWEDLSKCPRTWA